MGTLLVVVVLAFQVLVFGQTASRIPNSPYPVSKLPKHVYVASLNVPQNEQFALQSLSGVVAQSLNNNGAFLYLVDSGSASDKQWLSVLQKDQSITVNTTYNLDWRTLAKLLVSDLEGYVLYDGNSIGQGISVSGVSKSLMVDSGLVSFATSLGLKQKYDVRALSLDSVLSTFTRDFSYRIMTHMVDDSRYALYLSAYAIYAKAFAFSKELLGSNLGLNALKRLGLTSAVLGWSTSEFDFVETASKWSKFVHAADFSKNLPVLSNMKNDGIFHRVPLNPISPAENVHYVTFLMTDGDNLQWLQDTFFDPKWYGSPLRGKFPVGWTLSPALFEVLPVVASQIINTATPMDDFVAAPSGLGYMYPSIYPQNQYPDLGDYASLTGAFLKKFNFSILNVIDATYNAESQQYFLKEDAVDATLLYYYSNYAAIGGKVYWQGQKFINGPRWLLAQGIGPQSLTPQQLAATINKASTNVRSIEAWDQVAVHVWSMSLNDIQTAISLFDSHVRVVTPSDYVRLFKLYHPT